MYLTFYGLKRDAFHTTPDPSFLFMSASHKEALGAIVYGIEKRKGFVAITGEVGVGKTTILRAYLEGHSDSKQKTIYIFNPVLSYHDLLMTIFRNLKIVPVHEGESEMVNQLHETLIEEYKAGGTVTLLIDEAQNMPIPTLENLRMLSNLETSTDKLIQIILVGQSELETLLQQPALRQFQQRIALRAKICPLTEKESQVYILHRIAVASVPGNPVFTNKALQLIARKGQGIPRRMNILCDNALITGYGKQLTPVPASVVKETLIDIDGSPSPVLWKWALAAGFILLLGMGVMAFWGPLNLYTNSIVPPVSQEERSSQNVRTFSQSTSLHESQFERTGTVAEDLPDEHLNPQTSLKNQQRDFSNKEANVTNDLQPVGNGTAASHQSSMDDSMIRPATEGLGGGTVPSQELPDSQTDQFKRLATGREKSIMAQSVEASDITQIEGFRETGGMDSLDSSMPQVGFQAIDGVTVIRSVKGGESLSLIVRETYGSPNKEYIEWVKRHNPHIADPDFIVPGQEILLPDYQKETVSP